MAGPSPGAFDRKSVRKNLKETWPRSVSGDAAAFRAAKKSDTLTSLIDILIAISLNCSLEPSLTNGRRGLEEFDFTFRGRRPFELALPVDGDVVQGPRTPHPITVVWSAVHVVMPGSCQQASAVSPQDEGIIGGVAV